MGFSQVEAEFKRLKGQFEAGALTEADFKARLQDLMIQDEQGRWWMIGYETGQWYVHDGEKWAQSEPPVSPEETALQEPAGSSTVSSRPPETSVAAPVEPEGAVSRLRVPRTRLWLWVGAGVVGVILVAIVIAQLAGQCQAKPAPSPMPPATAVPAPANMPAPGSGAGPGGPLWADIYEIRPGECTVLHWNVPGAPWVRLVGPGFDADATVPGRGDRKVCPPDTAGFALQSPDRKFIAEVVIRVLQ